MNSFIYSKPHTYYNTYPYTPDYYTTNINTSYTPYYTTTTTTFSTDPAIKFYGNYTIDSVIYPMSKPCVARPKCYQVIYQDIYEPEQTEQATQTEQVTVEDTHTEQVTVEDTHTEQVTVEDTHTEQVTVEDIPDDDLVVLNEDAQDLITN